MISECGVVGEMRIDKKNRKLSSVPFILFLSWKKYP
jgi:hypothetical protein